MCDREYILCHCGCGGIDSTFHFRYPASFEFASWVFGHVYVSPFPSPTAGVIGNGRKDEWADVNSVGYIVSAILICAEYLRLGLFYRSQHIVLFISFVIKASFVVIEIGLAIAFGICTKSDDPSKRNPGAVLEWGKTAPAPFPPRQMQELS